MINLTKLKEQLNKSLDTSIRKNLKKHPAYNKELGDHTQQQIDNFAKNISEGLAEPIIDELRMISLSGKVTGYREAYFNDQLVHIPILEKDLFVNKHTTNSALTAMVTPPNISLTANRLEGFTYHSFLNQSIQRLEEEYKENLTPAQKAEVIKSLKSFVKAVMKPFAEILVQTISNHFEAVQDGTTRGVSFTSYIGTATSIPSDIKYRIKTRQEIVDEHNRKYIELGLPPPPPPPDPVDICIKDLKPKMIKSLYDRLKKEYPEYHKRSSKSQIEYFVDVFTEGVCPPIINSIYELDYNYSYTRGPVGGNIVVADAKAFGEIYWWELVIPPPPIDDDPPQPSYYRPSFYYSEWMRWARRPVGQPFNKRIPRPKT